MRIAAAEALCQLGRSDRYIKMLAGYIEDENYLAGMYAIGAVERLGEKAAAVKPTIDRAQKSDYEFTRRIARRLMANLE